MRAARARLLPGAALLLLGCRGAEAPSRWPIQRADGPLALQVRHPSPGDAVPASGRDYVMGSAGNGDARVTIGGERARVLRNGAFIAYVRAPAPGGRYEVRATLGRDSALVVIPVGGAASAASSTGTSTAPARVTRGDVVTVPERLELGLATEIPARDEPEGDYRWTLLPGTRGTVMEARGDLRRVRFAPGAIAWVDAQLLRAAPPAGQRAANAGTVRLAGSADETDVLVPAREPLAYEVTERDDGLTFTVHGARVAGVAAFPAGGYVARVDHDEPAAGTTRLSIALRGPTYGYDVTWRAGAMVLRLRHPPPSDPARPLAGLTIVVDAGHPPGGAVGPTGLAEPVVTLDVARRLEALLAGRGAHVVMTRRDTLPVSLEHRVALARSAGGHAFVSIHADAIPSGADPSRDNGTAVYANRTHSMALAASVHVALAGRLGLPDRGVHEGDYAVIRQSWMPAVLCEGATLTVPAQEAALADSTFRAAYAQGIADGLEAYFSDLRRRTLQR